VDLTSYVETLNVLGDESRLRLCALLRGRELCVSDLVHITGISQSRVSTHLGRLRDAGFLLDRRKGTQSLYTLALESLPSTAKAVLGDAAITGDPTLANDQQRLLELDAERREGLAPSALDELERYYSPGRTWQSLAAGLAALLQLGDVLDAGSGDGAAASALAPYCRSLTCIDTNARSIEVASDRLARFPHARALVADAHALPFESEAFDAVLLFHTLTYAEQPARALHECARVLRPGGRLSLLCLDQHEQHEVSARHAELHPGFSPRTLRGLVARTGLEVVSADVACREAKKPHYRVVLAIADKPRAASAKSKRTRTG
jgi:SAM-dependent methyltransferase